jgi:hypothetical protein
MTTANRTDAEELKRIALRNMVMAPWEEKGRLKEGQGKEEGLAVAAS